MQIRHQNILKESILEKILKKGRNKSRIGETYYKNQHPLPKKIPKTYELEHMTLVV